MWLVEKAERARVLSCYATSISSCESRFCPIELQKMDLTLIYTDTKQKNKALASKT